MNEEENQTSEVIFSYVIKKENKVFLYWYDKLIKIFSGDKAEKFLSKIQGASTFEAQHLMAKLAGNLKRKREVDSNTIIIKGVHYTRNKNNGV